MDNNTENGTDPLPSLSDDRLAAGIIFVVELIPCSRYENRFSDRNFRNDNKLHRSPAHLQSSRVENVVW